MTKLKIYAYAQCGSCRKALKYLDDKKVSYQNLPIREQPPTKSELKKMLKQYGGDLKRLFNTSGQDYRAMNIKEKLTSMSTDEAIELLSKNGNLVKRPFVIGEQTWLVGFKEQEWQEQGL